MTKDYAKEFATKIHEGQFRADGVTPFINHPARVAELVERNGGDECAVCVAWLHDVFEEGIPRIEQEWNVSIRSKRDVFEYVTQHDRRWEDVCLHVIKLTDTWSQDEINRYGKMRYLAFQLFTANDLVLTVKLCDMLANIEESNGSRMSQEKRYMQAVHILLSSKRDNLNMHQVTLCNSIIDMVEIHMSYRSLESVQHSTKQQLNKITMKRRKYKEGDTIRITGERLFNSSGNVELKDGIKLVECVLVKGEDDEGDVRIPYDILKCNIWISNRCIELVQAVEDKIFNAEFENKFGEFERQLAAMHDPSPAEIRDFIVTISLAAVHDSSLADMAFEFVRRNNQNNK